jgi:hypothetical protein
MQARFDYAVMPSHKKVESDFRKLFQTEIIENVSIDKDSSGNYYGIVRFRNRFNSETVLGNAMRKAAAKMALTGSRNMVVKTVFNL